MGVGEEDIIKVVQAFAGAAIDPARWLEALVVTNNALGAVCCTMEFADFATGEVHLENPLDLGQDVVAHYNERIFHINPRVGHAVRSNVGSIVSDPALLPANDPHTPEFLDWLAKTPSRYTQGSKLFDSDRQIIFYNAHYSKQQGPAGQGHTQFHRFLVPHLINFLHVGRELNDRQLRNELISHHDLDGGKPFALLNKAGNLVECSTGFVSILRVSALLGVRNNRLAAKHPPHRQLIEQFFRQATNERRFLDPPKPVHLTGPGNAKGLVLRAVPLPPHSDVFDVFRPAAMITLTDLDQPMKVRRKELATLFGLTEREADVAALIGEGQDTERTAHQLGISHYTVKQHLKAVFGKMSIERQSELVAILGRLF